MAAQPGEQAGSADAALAQVESQLSLQHDGFAGQIAASQTASVQPGVQLALQQSLPSLVRKLIQPRFSPQAKPDRLPLPSLTDLALNCHYMTI